MVVSLMCRRFHRSIIAKNEAVEMGGNTVAQRVLLRTDAGLFLSIVALSSRPLLLRCCSLTGFNFLKKFGRLPFNNCSPIICSRWSSSIFDTRSTNSDPVNEEEGRSGMRMVRYFSHASVSEAFAGERNPIPISKMSMTLIQHSVVSSCLNSNNCSQKKFLMRRVVKFNSLDTSARNALSTRNNVVQVY